jgi:hypothetical protein
MRDDNRKKIHILWCNYPKINVVRLVTFFSYTYKYQHVKQKFKSVVLKGKEVCKGKKIGTKVSNNLFFYYIDLLESFDLMRS